jgi:uncharacterized protein (TIGR00369 family)
MLARGMDGQDLNNERAVRDSFAQHGLMATLGAVLTRVAAGEVSISLPFSRHLTQQNGLLHGGAVSAIADTACGYAAMTVAPAGSNPLAVEFKVNLLAPARGERFEARAQVLRAGKTLTVVRADVYAITGSAEEMVATMLETTIVRLAGQTPR